MIKYGSNKKKKTKKKNFLESAPKKIVLNFLRQYQTRSILKTVKTQFDARNSF